MLLLDVDCLIYVGFCEMASNEGFLTEGQREMLKTAPPNVEILSSSPKSPTLKSPGAAAAKSSSVLLAEHHVKAPGGGKATTAGIAVRHVRRTHSGKHIRVKKGECSLLNRDDIVVQLKFQFGI